MERVSDMKKVKIFLLIFGISAICFAETPTILQIEQNKFNAVLSDNQGDSISQQKNRTPFVLKVSPFHIIQGDFITKSFSAGLSFEKPMKNRYSLHIGARYIFTDKTDDLFDKRFTVIFVERVNGFALDAELRRYFGKERLVMSGGYLSANLKNLYTKADIDSKTVDRFSTAAFINIGWQEIFKSGTVFDIAVGVGAKYVVSASSTALFYGETRHFMDSGKKPYHSGYAFFPFVNINFNLGYCFYKGE